MENGDRALRNALRRLSLPIAAGQEDDVLRAAGGALDELGVEREDHAIWLDLEAAKWRRDGVASRGFQRVVRDGLKAGEGRVPDGSQASGLGDRLASKYFQLHKAISAYPLFDHAHASALLSHARLAAVLARDERLSASMIASVLQARDGRTPIGWKVIEAVLAALVPRQAMTVEMVREVMRADREAEIEEFVDAGFDECAELLGRAGDRVHFGYDLGREALALFPLEEGDPLWPSGAHLVMLYYCAAQVEYWDHRVSSIYEFSPRGHAADEVARRFRDAGVYLATQNPFLNNAKSAPSVDREWAWTKGPAEAASAHALANVLAGLDELSFAPRRHIARLIRAWLMRILRVCETKAKPYLPDTLDEGSARSVAEHVVAGPTSTRGVLEQRFMDAVGAVIHGVEGEDLVARGLGDSVNANNASRRKFGDVEFQEGPRSVVAYEPHGGSLWQVYVDAHELSLMQLAEARLAEWDSTSATRGLWTLRVCFVAFSVGRVTLPAAKTLSGAGSQLTISYEVKTYEQCLAACKDKPLASAFSRYFLEAVSQNYVPNDVRAKVSGWLS